MRVLIVEDDASTAMAMELMLQSEGFRPYTTDLGEEAVDLAKLYDYDAITLDLNLPDISGFEVLRRLRAAKVSTPAIVVSCSSDIETKLTAFRAGADDFIAKPFHRDELVARLKAIIRRVTGGHAQQVITVGNIALNIDDHSVTVSGRRVHLTGKEYMVLQLLFLRKGQTITKEAFLSHLYGGMDEPEIKIVDVFLCKIRRKLSVANDGCHHIATVWGQGYVVKDDPTVRAPLDPYSASSVTAKIITRLRDGQATSRELMAATDCQPEALGYTLQRIKSMGLIENLARRPQGLYALTAAGQKWADARLAEQVAA